MRKVTEFKDIPKKKNNMDFIPFQIKKFMVEEVLDGFQAEDKDMYGVLGYSRSRKLGQNLVMDVDLEVSLDKIREIYANVGVWDNYVFYKVKNRNQLLITYESLCKLPESKGEFIHVVKNKVRVLSYFMWGLYHLDLTVTNVREFWKQYIEHQIKIPTLKHIMYNNFPEIRRQTLVESIKNYLRTCNKQELEQIRVDLGYKGRVLMTNRSRRKKILSYVERNF